MSEILTAAKILARTKLNSLSDVHSLNVWGNDLGDISVLRRLPNVEVLSLSVNAITSLADLSNCTQLRELYLRKNKIEELSEINYLVPLPNLKILWLSENPCCATPNYRDYILSKLPGLQKLDNTDITEEERELAMRRSGTVYNVGGPMLRPASVNENDFLSPKNYEQLQASPQRRPHSFGSPARGSSNSLAVNSEEGQRNAFTFSPKRRSAEEGGVQSPKRYEGANGDGGYGSPRRAYTVFSPQGSSYSPKISSRPAVPTLNFPATVVAAPSSSAASQPPKSSHRNLAQELEGYETSSELAARKRTEALEEEIRLLRAAEDAERAQEVARERKLTSPTRHLEAHHRAIQQHSSSPSSPRQQSQPQTARSGSSSAAAATPFSPNSSGLRSSESASGSSSTRHPFTSNHVYGALSSRPASARPAAGEKPNPLPVFARPTTSASTNTNQPFTARPSTAVVHSPRGVSSQPTTQAAPLSPRASYVKPTTSSSASSAVSHSQASHPWTNGGLTPRSSFGTPAPVATQHNLMCAALAMIEEFDLTHLEWLQKATQQKIEALQRR